MKKTLLITAIVTMAVAATACSSKKEPETTAATTVAETTTEATTEETTEEEIEEAFMTGIVTKINDMVLTIKSDDDDSEKEYDLSKAEITQDFPFSEGDWVEFSFAEGTTETPVPVITLEVMESVIGENTDPYVEGVVEDATTNTITLKLEDGNSYTLNKANAYVVAKNGITVDKKATVTYIGDLEDTDPNPLAVKIVMEDSYGSKDADKFAFTGTVAGIEEDSIVLESSDGDFYTFYSDEIHFSSYNMGETLQITYTGTITAKSIAAVSVTKK